MAVADRRPGRARCGGFGERLNAAELEHELSEAYHDRLIVSGDGSRVFVYAGTRKQAERARDLIECLAKTHGWEVAIELTHWHPEAEEWEAPDLPLPASDAATVAEHEELIAAERQRLAATGEPEFEVRVDLPSHREAVRFAELLRAESLPAVRRWKYLVVGATDEDAARALGPGSRARPRPAARSRSRAAGRSPTPSGRPTRSRCSAASAAERRDDDSPHRERAPLTAARWLSSHGRRPAPGRRGRRRGRAQARQRDRARSDARRVRDARVRVGGVDPPDPRRGCRAGCSRSGWAPAAGVAGGRCGGGRGPGGVVRVRRGGPRAAGRRRRAR